MLFSWGMQWEPERAAGAIKSFSPLLSLVHRLVASGNYWLLLTWIERKQFIGPLFKIGASKQENQIVGSANSVALTI